MPSRRRITLVLIQPTSQKPAPVLTGYEQRVVVMDLQTQVPGGSRPAHGQPGLRGIIKGLKAQTQHTNLSFPKHQLLEETLQMFKVDLRVSPPLSDQFGLQQLKR